MEGSRKARGRGGQQAGAILGGLGLIAVGLVLLLDRAGAVDAFAVLAGWWPLLVIAAGLWWIAAGAWLGGSIAGLSGLVLLAGTLDLVQVQIGRLVLPLLTLAVGGALLTVGVRLRAAPQSGMAGAVSTLPSRAPAQVRAVGETSATAIFGDADVVLDEAGLEGALAVVTVTVVFGDVRIQVPWGWRVRNRTIALFGEVTVPREEPPLGEAPVVELHGLVLLGDAAVRHRKRVEEV